MTGPGPDLVDLACWHTAIAAAALEIATYALGSCTAEVSAAVEMDATGLIGAHLPLLGGPHALEIALVGTPDNCRALAAAMLQTTTPESLSVADIADAVGETLNMIGGIVKRRVGNELEIGLPVVMIGHIRTTERISVTVPAKFGTIQMYVQLIGRRS